MSCLFDSISYFLKINGYNVRQKICDYLQQNNKIIDGLDTNYILSLEHNSSENYISKMRLIHTWGGAIEIQCACNIWGLCINVKNYRDNNNRTIEFIPLNNSYNKTIYVYWNGGHYEPITNM